MMNRLLPALIMSLFFISPAIAQPLEEQRQEERQKAWKMCLEQSPNFSRLPNVDEELGPMETLLERWEPMARMRQKQILRDLGTGKPMSPEELRQHKIVQRGLILLENCYYWHAINRLLAVALHIAAAPAVWREYLEHKHMRNQPQFFDEPEHLVQQTKALHQKSEGFDPTRPYKQQLTEAERQWSKDIGDAAPLLEGFERWLKERQ